MLHYTILCYNSGHISEAKRPPVGETWERCWNDGKRGKEWRPTLPSQSC